MAILNSGQNQQAGNNSTQVQTSGNVIINTGIDEKRVREIVDEKLEALCQEGIPEAIETSKKRGSNFAEVLMKRLDKVPDAVESFKDPSYLKLLYKAQQCAICTDSENDYEMLSELLVDRINTKNDRTKNLTISKAIELIDQIPEDVLNALTAYYILRYNRIKFISLDVFFDLIVQFYAKIATKGLPLGGKWIEQLSMLNGCYFNTIESLKKIDDFFPSNYRNIVQTGVKKDSDEYLQSLAILSSLSSSPQNILIDNILLPGYSCIYISELIEGYMAIDMSIYPMTDFARTAINKVVDLYDKSSKLKNQVAQNFMFRLKSDHNLNELFRWWDQIPVAPKLTDVGFLIANINARRLGLSVEKYNV